MKLKLTTTILIAAAFAGCQKSPALKTLNVSGVAKYVSSLSLLKDTAVLSSQNITLSSGGTSYQLLTDAQGLFAFPGAAGPSVSLSVKKMISDDNQYQATYTATAAADLNSAAGNIVLTATLDSKNFNGILLTVTDKNGDPINGAKIIGYSSGELAAADVDFAGIGSVFTLTSNKNGLALAMDLPAKIYLKAHFQASSTNAAVDLKSGVASVSVAAYQTVSIAVK